MINFKNFIESQNYHYNKEANKLFASLKEKYPRTQIYEVGGFVRDDLMSKFHLNFKNIRSKDIDYLIAYISPDNLYKFLDSKGIVKKEGASFAVLKFWFPGQDSKDDPLDIATPRIDKEKIGEKGHKAIDVISSEKITPEEDLKRRDFTINMIARKLDGSTLDPFGGELDIKNKILRMVKSSNNPKDPYHDFFVDPVRMMRGIQFIARFDLNYHSDIKKWFKIKAKELRYMSGERKKEELEKLFKKGKSIAKGLKLAQDTNMIPYIFNGIKNIDLSLANNFDNISSQKKSIEFGTAIILRKSSPEEIKKALNYLKFSNLEKSKTELYHIFLHEKLNEEETRIWMIKAGKLISNPLNFMKNFISILDQIGIDNNLLKKNIKFQYFFNAPKSFEIKGKDIINIGLKGKAIGIAQKKMTNFLIKNPSKNNQDSLIKIIS